MPAASTADFAGEKFAPVEQIAPPMALESDNPPPILPNRRQRFHHYRPCIPSIPRARSPRSR